MSQVEHGSRLAPGLRASSDVTANLQVFCRENSGYGCPGCVCLWPVWVRGACGLSDNRSVRSGARDWLSRDLLQQCERGTPHCVTAVTVRGNKFPYLRGIPWAREGGYRGTHHKRP